MHITCTNALTRWSERFKTVINCDFSIHFQNKFNSTYYQNWQSDRSPLKILTFFLPQWLKKKKLNAKNCDRNVDQLYSFDTTVIEVTGYQHNCKYTQQNKKIRQTRNEKRITLVKLLIWKAELDMFTCNIKFLLCAYFFLHFPTHSSKRSLLSFLL